MDAQSQNKKPGSGAQNVSALGFALRFANGQAVLRLDRRELGPGLWAEQIDFVIPGLRFPLDVSGGAGRFQGHRLDLHGYELKFDVDKCLQSVADEDGLLRFVSWKIESGVLSLHGKSGSAECGDFVAHVALSALPGHQLRLMVFDVVNFAETLSPTQLAEMLVEKICRGFFGELLTPNVVLEQSPGQRLVALGEALIQPILVNKGWKRSRLESSELRQAVFLDGQVHVCAGDMTDEILLESTPMLERAARVTLVAQDLEDLRQGLCAIGNETDRRDLLTLMRSSLDSSPHDLDCLALNLELMLSVPAAQDEARELCASAQQSNELALLNLRALFSRDDEKQANIYLEIAEQGRSLSLQNLPIWADIYAGEAWLNAGMADLALAAFKRVILLKGDEPRALHGAFVASRLLGDDVSAVSYGLRASRASQLVQVELELALGDIFRIQGDFEAARRSFRRVLRDDDHPAAFLGLAQIAQKQGDVLRAVALLGDTAQSAQRRDSHEDLLTALRLRALYQMRVLHDPSGALRSVEMAMLTTSTALDLLWLGAEAAAELNEAQQERLYLERAAPLTRDMDLHRPLRGRLGMVLYALKLNDAAEAHLQNALDRDWGEVQDPVADLRDDGVWAQSLVDLRIEAEDALLHIRAEQGDLFPLAELKRQQANHCADPGERQTLLLEAGQSYLAMERYSEAQEVGREALALGTNLDVAHLLVDIAHAADEPLAVLEALALLLPLLEADSARRDILVEMAHLQMNLTAPRADLASRHLAQALELGEDPDLLLELIRTQHLAGLHEAVEQNVLEALEHSDESLRLEVAEQVCHGDFEFLDNDILLKSLYVLSDKGDADAAIRLESVLSQEDSYAQDAFALRDEMIEKGCTELDVLRRQRQALYDQGETQHAAQLAAKISDLILLVDDADETLVGEHRRAAELALQLKQPNAALTMFVRFLEAAEKLDSGREESHFELGLSYLQVADIHRDLGQYDQAVQVLVKAALHCVDPAQQASIYKAIAKMSEHGLARPIEAAEALEKALRIRPDDDEAATALSKLYEFLGESEKLVSLHQRMAAQVGVSAQGAALLVAAGDVLVELDPVRALRVYHAAMDAAPESDLALQRILRVARHGGSYASLVRAYLHAARLHKDKSRVVRLEEAGAILGGLMMRSRCAVTVLWRVLELSVENTSVIPTIIEVARATRDVDFAEGVLEKLVVHEKLSPGWRVEALLALAENRELAQGDDAQAQVLYAQVLEIDPTQGRALDAMFAYAERHEDSALYFATLQKMLAQCDAAHSAQLMASGALWLQSRAVDFSLELIAACSLPQLSLQELLPLKNIVQEHKDSKQIYRINAELLARGQDDEAILREQIHLHSMLNSDPLAVQPQLHQLLQQLLQYCSDDVDTRMRLAEIWMQQKKFELAEEQLHEICDAVDSDGQRELWWSCMNLRAQAAERRGDSAKALEFLWALSTKDAQASAPLLAMARIQQKSNEPLIAAELLLKATACISETGDKNYTLLQAAQLFATSAAHEMATACYRELASHDRKYWPLALQSAQNFADPALLWEIEQASQLEHVSEPEQGDVQRALQGAELAFARNDANLTMRWLAAADDRGADLNALYAFYPLAIEQGAGSVRTALRELLMAHKDLQIEQKLSLLRDAVQEQPLHVDRASLRTLLEHILQIDKADPVALTVLQQMDLERAESARAVAGMRQDDVDTSRSAAIMRQQYAFALQRKDIAGARALLAQLMADEQATTQERHAYLQWLRLGPQQDELAIWQAETEAVLAGDFSSADDGLFRFEQLLPVFVHFVEDGSFAAARCVDFARKIMSADLDKALFWLLKAQSFAGLPDDDWHLLIELLEESERFVEAAQRCEERAQGCTDQVQRQELLLRAAELWRDGAEDPVQALRIFEPLYRDNTADRGLMASTLELLEVCERYDVQVNLLHEAALVTQGLERRELLRRAALVAEEDLQQPELALQILAEALVKDAEDTGFKEQQLRLTRSLSQQQPGAQHLIDLAQLEFKQGHIDAAQRAFLAALEAYDVNEEDNKIKSVFVDLLRSDASESLWQMCIDDTDINGSIEMLAASVGPEIEQEVFLLRCMALLESGSFGLAGQYMQSCLLGPKDLQALDPSYLRRILAAASSGWLLELEAEEKSARQMRLYLWRQASVERPADNSVLSALADCNDLSDDERRAYAWAAYHLGHASSAVDLTAADLTAADLTASRPDLFQPLADASVEASADAKLLAALCSVHENSFVAAAELRAEQQNYAAWLDLAAFHVTCKNDQVATSCAECAYVQLGGQQSLEQLQALYVQHDNYSRLIDTYEFEIFLYADDVSKTVSLHYNVANLLLEKNDDFGRAQSHLKQALELSPGDVLILRRLVEIERTNGDDLSLADALDNMAEQSPATQSAAMWIEAADLLSDLEPVQAIAYYRQALQKREDANAELALANLLADQGEELEAAEHWALLADVELDDEQAGTLWMRSAQVFAQQQDPAYLLRAQQGYLCAADRGKLIALAAAERIARERDDEEALEQILGQRALTTESEDLLFNISMERIEIMQAQERQQEAILIADKLRSNPPQDFEQLETLGDLYASWRLSAQALQVYVLALGLPNITDQQAEPLHHKLMIAKAGSGDLPGAVAEAQILFAADHADEAVRTVLEAHARETGDPQALRQILLDRIEHSSWKSEQAALHYELSQLFESSFEDVTLALEHAKYAFAAGPDQPAIVARVLDLTEAQNELDVLAEQLERAARYCVDDLARARFFVRRAKVALEREEEDENWRPFARQALHLDPHSVSIQRAVFDLAEMAQDSVMAAELAQSLLAQSEGDNQEPVSEDERQDWRFCLAHNALAEKKYDRAQDFYKQMIEAQLGDVRAYFALWNVLKKTDQEQEFLPIARQGMNEIDDAKQAQELGIIAAQLLFDADEISEAQKLNEQVLKADPVHSKGLSLGREIAARTGKYDKFANLLQVAINSTDADAKRLEILRELAEIYSNNLLDEHQATQCLEDILQLVPEDIQTRMSLAELRFHANDFARSNDLLAQLPQGLSEKRRAELLWMRAQSFHHLGETERFVQDCFETLAFVPASHPVWETLTEQLVADKQLDQALALVQRWQSEGASFSDGQAVRWLCIEAAHRLDLGEPDRAIDLYQQALERVPDHLEAMRALSDLFAREHPDDPRRAKILRRFAPLQKSPQAQADMYCDSADLSFAAHDYKLAQRAYQQALEVQPQFVRALASLARTALKRKDGRRFVESAKALFALQKDYLVDSDFHLRFAEALVEDRASWPLLREQITLLLKDEILDRALALRALDLAHTIEDFESEVILQSILLKSSENSEEIWQWGLAAGRMARDKLHDAKRAVGFLYRAHAARPDDLDVKCELAALYASDPSTHREALASYRQLVVALPSEVEIFDKLLNLLDKDKDNPAALLLEDLRSWLGGESSKDLLKGRLRVRGPLTLHQLAPANWPQKSHQLMRSLGPLISDIIQAGTNLDYHATDLSAEQLDMVQHMTATMDELLPGVPLQVAGLEQTAWFLRARTQSLLIGDDVFKQGQDAVLAIFAEAVARVRLATDLAHERDVRKIETALACVCDSLGLAHSFAEDDDYRARYQKAVKRILSAEIKEKTLASLPEALLDCYDVDVQAWREAARHISARVTLAATGSVLRALSSALGTRPDTLLAMDSAARERVMSLADSRDLLRFILGESIAFLAEVAPKE